MLGSLSTYGSVTGKTAPRAACLKDVISAFWAFGLKKTTKSSEVFHDGTGCDKRLWPHRQEYHRASLDDKEIDFVVINDVTDATTLATY